MYNTAASWSKGHKMDKMDRQGSVQHGQGSAGAEGLADYPQFRPVGKGLTSHDILVGGEANGGHGGHGPGLSEPVHRHVDSKRAASDVDGIGDGQPATISGRQG